LCLCAALWSFWMHRGYLQEGRQHCERALAGGEAAPPGLRARTLAGIAFIALFQGDLGTMNRAGAEALALSREAGDAETTALALMLLSVAQSRADREAARRLAEESLEMARRVGARWIAGCALHVLGVTALDRGDSDRAAALLHESLAVWQECGATIG